MLPDPSASIALLFAGALILSLHAAYELGIHAASDNFGKALGVDSRGAQHIRDAVTPPASTKLRVVNWLATLALLVYAFATAGVVAFILLLLFRIATFSLMDSLLSRGKFMPSFYRAVYRSMINREADYKKANDLMRGEAMADIRSQILTHPTFTHVLN
ncbi:hypothetical protein [Roseinatronobacter sp. NSM]|uniref:hypothetical protein n=1 Tax=Roseinatronobacter sp. NSM TaxID=3457785 RepID=UPI004036F8D2